MSQAITTRVFRSVSELEEIRGLWTSWQTHFNSDIDFYLMILRSRPQVERPHIIVLYRDGAPQGILVGRIEKARFDLKLAYASLLRPQIRLLCIVQNGVLGEFSEESSAVVVGEILKALRQGEADLAIIHYAKKGSPLYQAVLREPGWLARDHFPGEQMHRGLTLPASVDAFYAGLSSKARKNLRWQAKKFLQDFSGDVRVHCFRQPTELDQMFADVECLAQKTYQRGLGVGFADNAEMRRRMQLVAEKGWLRAHVLYVKEQPCAFWIGTQYGEVFYSNSMGYDAEYGKYSPGMFLVTRVIEELCSGREHVREIDFGLGDAQYKEVLGNQEWQEASVHIFGPSVRGYGLNALRVPVMLLDRAARKVLQQTKLFTRIKKIWRERLRTGSK